MFCYNSIHFPDVSHTGLQTDLQISGILLWLQLSLSQGRLATPVPKQ